MGFDTRMWDLKLYLQGLITDKQNKIETGKTKKKKNLEKILFLNSILIFYSKSGYAIPTY